MSYPEPEEGWLCDCGHRVDDDLHCDLCGRQPPWGCPCSGCDEAGEDDSEEWDEGPEWDWACQGEE